MSISVTAAWGIYMQVMGDIGFYSSKFVLFDSNL